MTPIEEAIDKTFDSGHARCTGGPITLEVCPSCATFLANVLHKAKHQVERLGGDDELLYFLTAFEADLIAQVERQTTDVDQELAAITS